MPEQALVATMRDDVIHDGCKAGDAVIAALPAMWVRGEVVGTSLAPFMVIAARTGRRTPCIMTRTTLLPGLLLTSAKLAVRHDVST